MTQPLPETPLNETDGRYLRQAIAWSGVARERGNRPFGAVVVADNGQVLAEAWCNTGETGDCTGHAETNAVRQLSPQVDRATLARATLYSSAEPCVMCAGAIFWSGIGRVVFGIDAVRLRVFRGERAEQRVLEVGGGAYALRGPDRRRPREIILRHLVQRGGERGEMGHKGLEVERGAEEGLQLLPSFIANQRDMQSNLR
jgi:tRNA(Arg) A34 adenosine deaminase TadA